MIESGTGLILRTRLLTETSLIVHWLTPEWGRIATVAKGARRGNSPFAGKLDLFYVADFSISRSRRSDLHPLREVQLHHTHEAIRADLTKLQQAAYAAACLELATETETPLPELYALLRGYLQHLCAQTVSQPQTVFAFELKFLRELGLEPDGAAARLSPGGKKILQTLLMADWPEGARLKLSAAQTSELEQFLGHFVQTHLGRLPRGRAPALGLNA